MRGTHKEIDNTKSNCSMVYSRFDIIRETTIERVRMYFNSAILVPYFDKKAHSNNDTYCDAGLF